MCAVCQILSNSPDSALDLSEEPSTPEGMVLLRSQLQHSNLVSEELREELLRIKNECLQLQGTKVLHLPVFPSSCLPFSQSFFFVIIMDSFMCYFSKLEHIAHCKAKNHI